VNGNPAPPEFSQKISLRKAGDLRGLAQGGFVGHKQANGEVQRRGLRRKARFQVFGQGQIHGKLSARVKPFVSARPKRQ